MTKRILGVGTEDASAIGLPGKGIFYGRKEKGYGLRAAGLLASTSSVRIVKQSAGAGRRGLA